MAERSDTDFFEVLIAQIRQDDEANSRFKKMQKCGQDRGLKTARSRAWNLHREGIP